MILEDLIKAPLWDKLKNEKRPILLYGMGNGADKILLCCEKYGIKISGVFASDGFVRNKCFHGMPIRSYSDSKSVFGEDFVVLLSFATSRDDVLENIYRIASQNELEETFVAALASANFRWEVGRFIDEHSDQASGQYFNREAFYQELSATDNFRNYQYSNRYDNSWMLPLLVMHVANREQKHKEELRRREEAERRRREEEERRRREAEEYEAIRSIERMRSNNSSFGGGFGGGSSSGGGFKGGW